MDRLLGLGEFVIQKKYLRKDLKSSQEILLKRSFSRKFLESQFSKARKKSREILLCQKTKKKASERIPSVVSFYPAVSGIDGVIESLLSILHASEDMKKVFRDNSMIAYRRPRNPKDKIS